MAQRTLRLEVQQDGKHSECGEPGVPRWYGHHDAITTSDITGSVMKILITDSKGKQISIMIDDNGSIQAINGDEQMKEDEKGIVSHLCKNSINEGSDFSLDKVKEEVMECSDKTAEEPGAESSSFLVKQVVEIISEGYNLETSNPELEEDEFHADMAEIKFEEIKIPGQFDTDFTNPEEMSFDNNKTLFQTTNDRTLPLLCRFCATQRQDMIHIFSPNETYGNIREKIEYCLPIMVRKTDTLPKQACRLCLEKLELCHKFRKTVVEAEAQLRMLGGKLSDESKSTENIREGARLANGQLDGTDSDSITMNHKTNSSLKDVAKTDDDDVIICEEPVKDQDIIDADIIKCRLCGEFFGTPKSCYSHSSIHVTENNYPCSICSKTFTTERDCYRHNLFIHIAGQACKRAAVSYKKLFNFKPNYIPARKTWNFRHTRKTVTEKDDVTEESAADQNCSLITCRICDVTFETVESCYIHSTVHATKNHYPCSICHKSFPTEKDCYRHCTVHMVDTTQEKKTMTYICNLCSKKFASEDRLEFHKIYHNSKIKPCYCNVCKKTLASESSLYQHMLTVHGKSEKYSCNVCKMQFSSQQQLNTHRETHKNRPFKCTFCDRAFRCRDRLNYHRELCRRLSSLTNSYTCSYCGKSFLRKCSLTAHIRIHTSNRPYKCNFCPKMYPTNKSKTEHELSHTSEARFKCSFCDKDFLTVINLKEHENLHSAECSYKCSLCTEFFSTENTRKKHVTTVHSKGKLYQCRICKICFEQDSTLQLHMKARHRL